MKDFYTNSNHTMFIVPVDVHEISLITLELNSRSSSGHDEFTSDVLMNTMNYFLIPLVHIINSSIITGIILKNMEIARLTLVFKVADKTKMSNLFPSYLSFQISDALDKKAPLLACSSTCSRHSILSIIQCC